MTRRFILAFLMLASFVTTGCASREPVILVAELKTPDWLMSPLVNTGDQFYGVGEGGSAQASEQAALAHLAERLLVQLSSTQEQRLSSVSDSREYTEREVESLIKSRTERLPLGGYEILKQDVIAPQRTATLLALKKTALINNLINEIGPRLTTSSALPIKTLSDWASARQQLTDLKTQQPLISLLKQLGESGIAEKYSNQVADTESAIKDYQTNHPVMLKTDQSCMSFEDSLERLILEAGFEINPSSGVITVECQVNEDISSAYGIHIAKANLSLRFLGDQSNVEQATTLSIKSASSASESTAKAGLVQAFNRRIQDEEALRILGL
jgi:hypothetical protein